MVLSTMKYEAEKSQREGREEKRLHIDCRMYPVPSGLPFSSLAPSAQPGLRRTKPLSASL